MGKVRKDKAVGSNASGASKRRSTEQRRVSLDDPISTITLPFSGTSTIIASWTNWRLLRYGSDGFDVKSSGECEELADADIPNFSPDDHKKLLKNAGWGQVTSPRYVEFGNEKKMSLFIFQLKGSPDFLWLSKSAFVKALGYKENYEDLFRNAADSRKYEVEGKRAAEDEHELESEDEDGDEAEGGANESDSEQEKHASDSGEEECTNQSDSSSSESEDHDGTPKERKPSPNRKSADRSRSKSVASDEKTSRTASKVFYARKVGSILWGVERKAKKYDMHKFEKLPRDVIHTEAKPSTGFAPKADAEYIKSITAMRGLEPEEYDLLGCVAFPRSQDETKTGAWKMAILELKDQSKKKALDKHRSKSGCRYRGDVLISMSVFQEAVRRDKEALEKANKLLDGTTYVKGLKKRGLNIRNVRHVTLTDDMRSVHDELRRMNNYFETVISMLNQLSIKPRPNLVK